MCLKPLMCILTVLDRFCRIVLRRTILLLGFSTVDFEC